MTDPGLAALRGEIRANAGFSDSKLDFLEARVIALEEVLAARWPARLLAAYRLGRRLRASVRRIEGGTWAERRSEAASIEWHIGREEGLW